MTLKEFLGIGRVRSKMDVYRRKKQAAIDICVEAFDKSKRPYIALSGGKDSVAMCFIVDEAARMCGRDYRIWSHLSDASFPGTEEVCREVAERLSRPIDLDICPASAFDALQNQQKQAFGKTGVFFDAVRKYAADKDLSFVGVRAKESKRRNFNPRSPYGERHCQRQPAPGWREKRAGSWINTAESMSGIDTL